MKYYKYIACLLLFLSCKAAKEITVPSARPPAVVYNPYVVNWTVGDETFIIEYRVQRNRINSKNGWSSIDPPVKPLKATQNAYNFKLPKTSTPYYYRVIQTLEVPIKKGTKKYTYPTLVTLYLPNTNLK